MQCGILGWILKQKKKNTSERTGENQIKSESNNVPVLIS